MDGLAFAERFVSLGAQRFSLADRPYLRAPYLSTARRLVLRASRQVEKTTFLVNAILHTAVTRPGVHVLFACPRQEQALVFSKSRLQATLQRSPWIRRVLLGRRPPKLGVRNLRFANGAEVYIRAAYHSADAARGIDADLLVVDEYQDIAGGDLPVLEEALSHSNLRRVILAGTPKAVDNHLESGFSQSTACEWLVACSQCGNAVRPDERCLGAAGPMCPGCQAPLRFADGSWVAQNAQSTWGEGFWINHLMAPWVDYADLLERQRTYDPVLFKNECLGIPSFLGEHVVTRAEVEACCSDRPMAQSFGEVPAVAREHLVAGIDWGGGGRSRTVLVIGYMEPDNHFHVVWLERFAASEEPTATLDLLVRTLRKFRVVLVAADAGGNGSVYNPLLLKQLAELRRLFGVLYSAADQAPQCHGGRLYRWTVARSPALGTLFSRIKSRMLVLPRLADTMPFIDDLCCEVAKYDNYQRTIRYTHPDTQPDDAVHALNYAALLGRLWLSEARRLT
jgi:hypothetical protein